MILAVLDDLMFSSKVKSAAAAIGRPVAFARSAEKALEAMRQTTPALVIFDLNNPRIDTLAIVAAMKADPALAGVETIAYASHVHVDLMQAGRAAGISAVMARSQFTQQLAEILSR